MARAILEVPNLIGVDGFSYKNSIPKTYEHFGTFPTVKSQLATVY